LFPKAYNEISIQWQVLYSSSSQAIVAGERVLGRKGKEINKKFVIKKVPTVVKLVCSQWGALDGLKKGTPLRYSVR
jgi:hypothetical protein